MMFADAKTFLTYNANMRQLMVDKLQDCEMIVLNRTPEVIDKEEIHRVVRSVSTRASITYDYPDGHVEYDEIEDPLPFDINAPIIMLNDEDYALWYRDITEEPEKYNGKVVEFKGQVALLRRTKENMFAPGRFVMTCCVDDIQFCGIPCNYAGAANLEPRSWIMVKARVSAEKHPLYKGEKGPVLTAISVTTGAEPADPDVCTF